MLNTIDSDVELALPDTNQNPAEVVLDALRATKATGGARDQYRLAIYYELQAVAIVYFRAKSNWAAYRDELLKAHIEIRANACPDLRRFLMAFSKIGDSTASERTCAIKYAATMTKDPRKIADFLANNGGVQACYHAWIGKTDSRKPNTKSRVQRRRRGRRERVVIIKTFPRILHKIVAENDGHLVATAKVRAVLNGRRLTIFGLAK